MDAIGQTNGKPYIPPVPLTLPEIREERKRIRAETRYLEESIQLEALKKQQLRAKESWGGWYGQPGSPQQSFLGDRPNLFGAVDFGWHRMYGSNYPFWLTWVHHSMYRYQARYVWTTTPNARGGLETIASYVLGKELIFKAAGKKKLEPPPPLLAAVQQQIDLVVEVNKFGHQQTELFVRNQRDGEAFVREFPEPNEPLSLRIVEPAEIMEPAPCDPMTDSYGIINRKGDIYDVVAYNYAPDGNTAEGERVKADRMHHSKNLVDSHVKRGLSDLSFGTLSILRESQVMIENMLNSGIEQSEIREIVEHEAASPQQVSAFRAGVTGQGPGGYLSVGGPTAPNGGPGPSGPNFFPGRRGRSRRLDIDSGQKYVDPPFTSNTEGYWKIVDGSLRNAAVVWGAPQWVFNGEGGEVNYASSLTIESPFVKRCLKAQGRWEQFFLKIIWNAIKHACDWGMVKALGRTWSWEEVRQWIEIQVEAPSVETRDLLKEAQANAIKNQARVLSAKSWQLQDELDPEEEEANFEEMDELTGGMGNQLGTGDDEGDQGGQQRQQQQQSRESRRLRDGFRLLEGWVTIGSKAKQGEDEEHGGAHVYIDGAGRIAKGPAHMVGKKPSELSQADHDKAREPKKKIGDPNGGRRDKPSGGTGTPPETKPDGGSVAKAPERPGDQGRDQVGKAANKPASDRSTQRVPASRDEVNKRLDRYTALFRGQGQEQAADWMDKLRDHVNSVGTDAALKALGEEVTGGKGEGAQYAGWQDIGDFTEHYLDRNGITLVRGEIGQGGNKVVSTVAPTSDEWGTKSRGDQRDVFPSLQTLKDKLDEAKHLPGLEKSEDIGKLMGKEMGAKVDSFSPEVITKLNDTYGEGKWIVKSYGDEAYAGYGIFFPQRVGQLNVDAKNAMWSSGAELAKYGFSHLRDESGKVVGIKHEGGAEYKFGTAKYNDTINGEARTWGDKAAAAANDEKATSFPDGKFMAQPAFPVVGISNEERAAGVTFKTGQEGRVHIITRNGKAELVKHSTWLKNEHLPVVFESDDTRAMAQAAVDAINALPETERKGQLYAPDVVRTADGFKVVEANPANEAGASGYLQDNPMIIDSYVSQIVGREPGHVRFIRKLLTKKAKP